MPQTQELDARVVGWRAALRHVRDPNAENRCSYTHTQPARNHKYPGTWASAAETDFYVNDEVAQVANTSLVRKHSEYFVKQINKLEEIIASLI